jgi:two-component system OmpR family sensor kinase/two-component system sensor histidine kinase QseC
MGALTYRNVLGETEALFDYQLRQMALSLRDQGEIAPEQASTLNDEQLDVVVQIWTVDGRIIYPPRLRSDLPSRARLGFADIAVEGKTWRTFSVATGDRVIQVAQPLQIRQQLAADAALRSVAPLFLIAPALALVLWWLAARALAPLQRVTDGVKARDELSLQPLPTGGLPDEVAPLVGALNGLLQRLGDSLGAQRAFVADAAHELRSPLTALKLQLQLLQRSPDDGARGRGDACARGRHRSCGPPGRATALAGTRGAGHRHDDDPHDDRSGRRGAQRGRGDAAVRASARHAHRDRRRRAGARPGRCGSAHGAGAQPRRQRGALCTAGLARRRQGLERRRRADAAGRRCRPGHRPADRERVFDRFYRHAAGDESGSGLGLAIVRGIAAQHRAGVTLEDSPLGGLRVVVRFAE